jgi:hypothetical protein
MVMSKQDQGNNRHSMENYGNTTWIGFLIQKVVETMMQEYLQESEKNNLLKLVFRVTPKNMRDTFPLLL